ncbi:threonine-phosphate decarboxylase CobD [Methylocystis sp. MJC1]|jgi:cobalamin biosynthetic protein CobC|uniref:threonine-phosphate decarboxylase CobD n=1 Tax=Methylocystis sp. MJC1 TaxID=2654282 RepID=UPI0013EC8DC5|nr:threonine-phosphate decarboxylase CobD [Methylocystis sp. MJC1]KAF2990675.1 Threonine-phosphate decarboxylase [Methylocystis sp. MJC1]MBU6528724.1 threonine-phosphate decarboxylase [Methylocystis sp. MJC1]UZX11612.1 threonine-phosphate decarboxylase CobD [Methylocystis sp. MJC1]
MSAHAPLSSPIAHGGRLDAARRAYPNAPEPWIDLSTGINPTPYSLPVIAPEAWTRLPDEAAFASLEAAARAAYRAPRDCAIVAGAGAQAFIQLLPRVFPARRVGVLDFTYAEHGACWAANGAKVETVATIEELMGFDVAVVVNPNNPDGRIAFPCDLGPLAQEMTRKGGLLIIDESFMDFALDHSASPLASLEGVVVLRSFGKAYGLAGLRLGFALCAPARAAILRAALGPWAVSGPALAIGAQALADSRWRDAAAAACATEAARLDATLTLAGFELLGGTSLFRLFRHDKARDWFVRLCEKGVLVRAFPERPNWLRFGLPGSETAWMRLSAALEIG